MSRLVCATALLAAPVRAEVARVDTPQGLARVEGSPPEGGQRLVLGERVALAAEEFSYVWIEAERGSLLLVGLGSGGAACPALWTCLDVGDPGFRRTEESGTCSDLAKVTSGSETVTVTMPSFNDDDPTLAFVWVGKGAVVEVPQGQQPSGMEPGDPAAWIGACASGPFRASDWRRQLETMMGPDAYRKAQEVGDPCAPMEWRGEWVVGTATGHRENSGYTVALALGTWDAAAVGIWRPDGTEETWGGASPELLAALAEGG